MQDTQMTTQPSGDGTGGPTDKIHETSPFIYDRRLASSEITVASYKTAMESIHDTATATLSSGHAGIERPIDKVPETNSFTYDSDLATSGTSIGSYKTEKTVISTKSRYNILPRHKYADYVHLRVPQGDDDGSLSSPPSPRLISHNPEPGPSYVAQPLYGHSAALPGAEVCLISLRKPLMVG